MHHDPKRNAPLLLIPVLLVTAAGCEQAETGPPSALVERMAEEPPILTSTLGTEAPQGVDADPEDRGRGEDTEEASEADRRFMPRIEPIEGLTLERLVTASAVEDREPAATASIFGDGNDRIYAFLEAANASDSEQTLVVHFIGPNGEVSGGVELRIPASVPRWRTWAYTRNAKAPGLWRVEIRSPQGELLGALPFEIQPDC